MKKFVSMAMVAAMTTSMVPATAFAGVGDVSATAKIVDAWTVNKEVGKDGKINSLKDNVPELQLTITDTNYKKTADLNEQYKAEITVSLDNAELTSAFTTDNIGVRLDKEYLPESGEVTDAITNVKTAANALVTGGYTDADVTNGVLKPFAEMPWASYDLNNAANATTNPLLAWNNVGAGALKDMHQAQTDLNAVGFTPSAKAQEALDKAKAELAAVDGNIAAMEKDVTTTLGPNAWGAAPTYSKENPDPNSKVGTLKTETDEYNEAAAKYDAAAKAKQAYYDKKAELTGKTGAEKDAIMVELYGRADGDVSGGLNATPAQGKYTADSLFGKYDKLANAGGSAMTEGAVDTACDGLKTAMYGKEVDMLNAKGAAYGGDEYEVNGSGKVVVKTPNKWDPKTAPVAVLEAKEAEIAAAKANAASAKAAAQAKVDAAEEAIRQEQANNPAAKDEKEKADAARIVLDKAIEKYNNALKAYKDAVKAQENGAAGNFEIKAVDGITQANTRAAMSAGSDKFTFVVEGELHKGDVIYIDLDGIQMDKTSIGRTATLDVESDDLNIDVTDLVYVSVEDYGIEATTDKVGNIAEEEVRTLEKDLKIESTVGNFVNGQTFELKLSNGFEFTKNLKDGADYTFGTPDGDEVLVTYTGSGADKFTIDKKAIEIEATSAKSGKEAVLTIKAVKGGNGTFKATTKVTLLKVVDYTVLMSVDEDEDIPVIYSGVDVDNYGITDDSDHLSLEVTVEESFPGAWSMRKGFNFELPDGVYVTELEVLEAENFWQTIDGSQNPADEDVWETEFATAYQETDHKGFEFKKHVFDDINADLEEDPASMTFQMKLVADPGFVGDVNLKFTGDLVDEQEVTIAKFATPYYVTAEQNDLKIDYRYTSVPTEVVITEAEAGLWDKDEAKFALMMEKADKSFFEFEDAVVSVDEESGMEIESDVKQGAIEVEMDDDSDDTAAVITVSDIEMFMSRSIPAGPYDLEASSTLGEKYLKQTLFAPDDYDADDHKTHTGYFENNLHDCDDCNKEFYVGCVADFSTTVKEAFINVVTAGREQDDASFTTKVVVPVGESYIVAGENQFDLDVPAYVSAAGYTMLPVRAVATALGINNNNVIWNGETKTVTILYGQRIITMVAGQKTVNVNGSVIPASAAVEIVDGRTFLPMRDLATALGVTDITWDAATKTATLNGGVVAE